MVLQKKIITIGKLNVGKRQEITISKQTIKQKLWQKK